MKRHDSVSAVVSLAGARELYLNPTFEAFISDSTSDNYPTLLIFAGDYINTIKQVASLLIFEFIFLAFCLLVNI